MGNDWIPHLLENQRCFERVYRTTAPRLSQSSKPNEGRTRMKTQAEVRAELMRSAVAATPFGRGYSSALMWVLEESEKERSRQIREAISTVAKRLQETKP